MDIIYQILKFIHVIGFAMMAVPLFNLIVVNERGLMGASFNYATDRYMENIIKHGATRCYVFQFTVLISGLLLTLLGPLGFSALWTNWIIISKTAMLFILMGLLSYVHLKLQPQIELLMESVGPNSQIPDDFAAKLKPYRLKRKKLATVCLFIVFSTIILGIQVYVRFHPLVTIGLAVTSGWFAMRANKTLIRFGWL